MAFKTVSPQFNDVSELRQKGGRIHTAIVGSYGFGVTDHVRFEATSADPITEQAAHLEQIRLGYHPVAFGFNGFRISEVNGVHMAHWSCFASTGD